MPETTTWLDPNTLGFFEAHCKICNCLQKTEEMYLCDGCNEPVCENCGTSIKPGEDFREEIFLCTDCN